MREYGFHNWDGGEVAVETITTEIAAYSRRHGDRCVDLVGRADPIVVELIKRALVDDVAAMNPESTFPVESTARIVVTVIAYSAPAADGSRLSQREYQSLPVDATDAEVRKVSSALATIAGARLDLKFGKLSKVQEAIGKLSKVGYGWVSPGA